jgi:predicted anti-sigma-YlaC factor YlaD
MMTCREATSLATEAAEGALPRGRRVQLWFHLMMCAACRRYHRQIAMTITVVRQLARREPPPPVPGALREAYRQVQKEKSR